MVEQVPGVEYSESMTVKKQADAPAFTQIRVLPHGPYQIDGSVQIANAHGDRLEATTPLFLCRCGGSRNKPFCDATHGLKGFDGSEQADKGPRSKRQAVYKIGKDALILLDDRSRCAHAGQCSARLPSVFRVGQEPFVKTDQAAAADILPVVNACPSGALSIATSSPVSLSDGIAQASVTAQTDGPFLVQGPVEVIGADGQAYEQQPIQTLCRCGLSENRPFCDG